ncbi:MAG TPA: hypothetical protein DEB40_14610 [Elusimicrobia bacterium]|nr:hypothetical protein [Elusimicrobiota bacterium]HBT62966.1 hypothetical protein [Elusimicrobiota bacterium]
MTENLDLVVSIAHYNTPELLKSCLRALAEEGSPLKKKIVVIDNASTPALQARDLAEFPDVDLIQNTSNTGFGSANNQAFARWRAEAYLVTNPDVHVSPGSLSRLLDRLRAQPKLGIIGAGLRYPDGRGQASCRRYPTLRSVLLRGLLPESLARNFPSIRRYMMLDDDIAAPTAVDWVLGSCLFMRGRAVHETGGFDENFFMYYEDVDLCCRVRQAGWLVEYNPSVQWTHEYRRESARSLRLGLKAAHFKSAMRFLRKHLAFRGAWSSI